MKTKVAIAAAVAAVVVEAASVGASSYRIISILEPNSAGNTLGIPMPVAW